MTCQCSCCQEHAADVARLNRALAELQEENRVAVASFNSEWARATRALVAATIAGKERDAALAEVARFADYDKELAESGRRNGALVASLEDTAHRSRCDLLESQHKADRLLAEIAMVERQMAKMRPVVDAALLLMEPIQMDYSLASARRSMLSAAVDAYRKAKP